MASDRGTLSRGAGPGADHSVPGAPTAPAGRRLPSAPRERRPALAALAVLLIIGGALAATALVLETGKRVTAIEITQQVSQGQQIPASAMQPVQVASGTGLHYVPWSQEASVARYFAATTIPAGTLLTNSLAAPTGTSLAGKEEVGLALKDGQMPSGLAAGNTVAAYAVSNSGGGSTGCPAPIGTVLSSDAVVVSKAGASNASNTGTTDVTVAVDPADAAKVSCAASAGGVALAQVPPGSSAAASGGGSQQGQPGTAPSAGPGTGTGSAPGVQPSGAAKPKRKTTVSPTPGIG
jgi:hypothetical protein